MLQQAEFQDFIVATGRSVSLQYFIECAFAHFGLDWRRHVRSDASLFRPSDIRHGAADPSRVLSRLNWRASVQVEEVISRMCDSATQEPRT
jgi:GDPmannose 4,6-dehydratase